MTNREIWDIAMKQSAVDANCDKNDFTKRENVIVASAKNPGARKYLQFPMPCTLISYGTNIVASIDLKYRGIVEPYIGKYPVEHCFETPNMYVLNKVGS